MLLVAARERRRRGLLKRSSFQDGTRVGVGVCLRTGGRGSYVVARREFGSGDWKQGGMYVRVFSHGERLLVRAS